MILPNVPPVYDPRVFAQWKIQLEQANASNHKRGVDIEIGPDCRAIFTDTTDGTRQAVTVAAGVVTVTAL